MVNAVLADGRWIARGAERTSLPRFLLWLAPWAALLAAGVYAAGLCLYYGLNQTNMDNRFAFGLWIFLDLGIIALGAGAFFTGFLVYILKRAELMPILNTAVVVGFICYSGAIAILLIDVGQPLRAWFTFWHPNTHSMLTEVTFCISCYLLVLCLEYIPILLRNRQLRKLPSFLVFEHQLHKLVPVLAAVGALLSFFHRGTAGRALWRAARPPVRLPRRIPDLAVYLLLIHPVGDRFGTKFPPAGDRDCGKGDRPQTRAPRGVSAAGIHLWRTAGNLRRR
jgi:molybdopterin-containing oxidoreductase family membrane subunit